MLVLEIRETKGDRAWLDPCRLRPIIADGVDKFLGLLDVLRLRACGAALHTQYGLGGSLALWDRIKPPVNSFHRIARRIDPHGAALVQNLYTNSIRGRFRSVVDEVACREGDFDLVYWLWSRPDTVPMPLMGPSDSFIRLGAHGHVDIAAWLKDARRLTNDDLRHVYPVAAACKTGDVATAEWLIRVGYSPKGAEEVAQNLLITACRLEFLKFAAWVLRRFPIVVPAERLCSVIWGCCCATDRAPLSARFLIESFDLSWDDLRPTMVGILGALDVSISTAPDSPIEEITGRVQDPRVEVERRRTHGHYVSVRNWLAERFGQEKLTELLALGEEPDYAGMQALHALYGQ